MFRTHVSLVVVVVCVLADIIGTVCGGRHGSYVVELDDEFEKIKQDAPWLVEFYAPWCGHCKKLEPVFEKVAASLDGTNIKPAKVDATHYSAMATKYEVRGFPTIMFIKGDQVIEYHGDRTAEDLVRFAVRANSPPLQRLHSVGGLRDRQRKPGVFFLYVGEDSHRLFSKYNEAAKNFSITLDFYQASEASMKEETAEQPRMPVVLVYKDHQRYRYDPIENSNFAEWISEERFTAVQSASGSVFYDLMALDKTLILMVAQESDADKRIKQDSKRVIEIVHKVALDRNWRSFQFVHMESTSIVSNIVLGSISVPTILGFNPATYTYHLPQTSSRVPSEEELKQFLNDIATGKNKPLGGKGFVQQMKRALYGLFTTIIDIWVESRLLFAIVVLVPTLVICIVCYTLCCVSWGEDEGEEETAEDEDSENDGAENIDQSGGSPDKDPDHLKKE